MTADHVHTVQITGDAGLRAAQEIAASLSEALAAHDTICVATDAVTSADITTIQLLLAARKQAQGSGKSLSLAGAPAGALRDLLVATGCLTPDGRPLSDDGDFWAPATSHHEGNAA